MANSFKTFLKHTAKDFHNQSVNPPIVRASTIIFKSMNDIRKTQAKYKKDPRGGHFDYGRQGTSTTHILQKILSKLEESYHTFLTPTGFGSVFLAIFSIVRPGDEILTIDPVYNPTRMLTQDYLKEYGIKTTFYNPHDLNSIKKNITKKTKLIFVENPGSNTFEFQDLSKIISIAKKNNILTAIDNTWATPYFFKPIKLGFDMAIVSATKYYSGHSDVMGGSLAVNKRVFKHIEKTQKITVGAEPINSGAASGCKHTGVPNMAATGQITAPQNSTVTGVWYVAASSLAAADLPVTPSANTGSSNFLHRLGTAGLTKGTIVFSCNMQQRFSNTGGGMSFVTSGGQWKIWHRADASSSWNIIDDVNNNGGQAILTSNYHKTGTDRIYEALKKIGKQNTELIMNLQGDEPLMNVDDIRNLNDQVRIPPQKGKYKVYIIDEVHMLSQSAFNAFLKTLEEPPAHALFVLATTEKHKIIPTILSRCQVYDFHRISVPSMIAHLSTIAEKEGVKVEKEALHVIAEKADGALRDALSCFDLMVNFCNGNITYSEVVKNLN